MRNLFFLGVLFFSALGVNAQSSGGAFQLISSTMSNGGGTSQSGIFNLGGTVGQPTISQVMNTSPFTLRGGFWQPDFSPTATTVVVSGRVLAPNGAGLRSATVILTGGSLSRPFVTQTGSFGYFTFDGLEAGQAYVVTVLSKRYGFAEATQVVVPFGDVSDLSFHANWEN